MLAIFEQGVSPSPFYAGESDTYISNGSPDYNYGIQTTALAGPYAGIPGVVFYGTRRILIKFDISNDMPPGIIVTDASLVLYCYDAAGNNTLTAYRVTQPWIEGMGNGQAVPGATWNSDGTNPWTGGTYGSPAGAPVSCSASNLYSYVRFSLDPAIVQSWIDDPAGNNGLLIIASNEDTSTTNSITFNTKEANELFKPALNIYYKLR
jgi:hypothetical protein